MCGNVCCLHGSQLPFKFLHSLLKLLNNWTNGSLWKPLVDVLGAVDVPSLDFEEDGPFDFAGVVWIMELFLQVSVSFDDLGLAPQFDATAVDIVHEENECLRSSRIDFPS